MASSVNGGQSQEIQVTDTSQGNQEDLSSSESSATEDESDSNTEESDKDTAEPRETNTPSELAQCYQDQGEPCKYYNKGHCRDGKKCHYVHICKYSLKGSCRYGSTCRLKHPRPSSDIEGSCGRRETRRSSHGRRREDGATERSSSIGTRLDFSGPYKWQLNDGDGWKDIANDHILEAQYSQPKTKGIHIYNTPYGKVCIDFKSMRVHRKKNLRVRRLEGYQTEWIWYYHTSRGWIMYGEKDSKGNSGPVQSSEIEKKFQSNRNGSLTFNIGSDTFEIKFRQMRQVGGKSKRRISRRPRYQPPESGNLTGVVESAFQRMSVSSVGLCGSPKWEFGGQKGKRWHSFDQGGSSVSSADIEDEYQQNSSGTMRFTVNGDPYELDFSAMTQTNLKTGMTRKIRRV
ncbi:hypothetical protein UPYG_G00348720 [Umbra pygmaea]|uniref:Uncharacterized protein n=1 Tax=Umbra pygmaea TaxID=75934 RepID=A0ABD0VZK8_UMBPY